MKKADEVLHKIQSRFGKITKEKVIERLIVVMIWAIPSAILIYIYVTLSDGGRIWMTVLIAIAITAYVIVRVRKRKIKIPIKKTDEKYVAIEKPTTAEIPITPISAEKQYINPTHGRYQPARSVGPPKPIQLDEVELSQFARKRIAEEDNLDVRTGAFELRKSAKVLFFQFPKRIPTTEKVGEAKDPKTGQIKPVTRTVRPPRSTIYGELLLVLASLAILLSPFLLSVSPQADWAKSLSQGINRSEVVRLIILAVGGVLTFCTVFLFYRKWAYWRFWRLILLPPGPHTGRYGYLVVIDKPPLLGGGAPLIDLRKVNTCYLSTGISERDEKGLSGMWMNILRIRWMIVDIPGDKDTHVNLMGPLKLREAAPAADTVKKLSASIHTKDYE